jgi:hypothetical protein
VEQQILETRHTLRTLSDLGEYGAAAIQGALIEAGVSGVPSLRTINRVLERHGVFDGQHRQRWPAPPRGWYLPDVATGLAELEQFDVIEGLILEGHGEVQVLTGIALHSGLSVAVPTPTVTAAFVGDTLLTHWRTVGCPAYVQFDNDTRFQGPHQYPDIIGRVMRLALGLGITVVFAPPRETGFQAAIESFNGRFEQKVWERFHHDDLSAFQACTTRYLAAVLHRCALRFETAPARHPVSPDWEPNWQAVPTGTVIYLRRTDDQGHLAVLGHTIPVSPDWTRRLVRAEVSLPDGPIRLYALRRRAPHDHPLLSEIEYHLPRRHFLE